MLQLLVLGACLLDELARQHVHFLVKHECLGLVGFQALCLKLSGAAKTLGISSRGARPLLLVALHFDIRTVQQPIR